MLRDRENTLEFPKSRQFDFPVFLFGTRAIPALAPWLSVAVHAVLPHATGISGISLKGGGKVGDPRQINTIWRRYKSALATHPVTTKALTSGVISGTGFFLAHIMNNPAGMPIVSSQLAAACTLTDFISICIYNANYALTIP